MSWPGQAAVSGQILHSTNDLGFIGFGLLNGDVVGLLEGVTVSGIAGTPVEQTVPGAGQVLKFDGTNWAPGTDNDSGAAAHDILGPQHGDANDFTVTRGALIVGTGAIPAWGGLTVGTNEFVLFSDGTDAVYTRLGAVTPFSLGTASAPSMTFTADTDTGWSAATADNLVGSAGGSSLLTLNGASGNLDLNAGQVVQARDVLASTNITNNDYIVTARAAPATHTLPGAPASGQTVVVKDANGFATNANRITIAGGGINIDGNASIEIRNAFGSFTLVYNGQQWNVV